MTRIQWMPYEIGDEEKLSTNRWVDRYGESGWRNLRNNLRSQSRIIAFTFIDGDGNVHGIGGYVPYNQNNAEVFTVINDESLLLPWIPKAVRGCLDDTQEDYGFSRAFAVCRSEYRALLDGWFTYLGMREEAFIKAWEADGSDVYFYARLLNSNGEVLEWR